MRIIALGLILVLWLFRCLVRLMLVVLVVVVLACVIACLTIIWGEGFTWTASLFAGDQPDLQRLPSITTRTTSSSIVCGLVASAVNTSKLAC